MRVAGLPPSRPEHARVGAIASTSGHRPPPASSVDPRKRAGLERAGESRRTRTAAVRVRLRPAASSYGIAPDKVPRARLVDGDGRAGEPAGPAWLSSGRRSSRSRMPTPRAHPARSGGAGGLRQGLADGLEHAVGLERLDDEVLGAELDRLEDLGLLAEGRAHDDLGGRVERDDLLQRRETVLLGHRDVERRDLGLELLEASDRLRAVAGLSDDLVATLGQRVAHHLPHERGVIDYQDSGHEATSISFDVLEDDRTVSIRTAQSVPSTTIRRPVAKRVPLTYRSIGSSAAWLSSTTEPDGMPTTWAEGIRVRPSSAHTRTGMPASEGRPAVSPRTAFGLVAAAGSAGGAISDPSSSSARVMRTTNAFGTSWISRHGSPQTVKLARTACGVGA